MKVGEPVMGSDIVKEMPNFLPDEGIVGEIHREIKTDMLDSDQKMMKEAANIQLGEAKENREHLDKLTSIASEYQLSEQRAVAKGLSFDVLVLEVYRKGIIMGKLSEAVTTACRVAVDQETNFEIVRKGEKKNVERN